MKATIYMKKTAHYTTKEPQNTGFLIPKRTKDLLLPCYIDWGGWSSTKTFQNVCLCIWDCFERTQEAKVGKTKYLGVKKATDWRERGRQKK